MITLFKKQKSDQELIDEIHNEFDTAPDRLLEQALQIIENESNSKVILESEVLDKAERLEKLGFIKNGLVAKKSEIEVRNMEKDKMISITSDQAELIKYYKDTYPFIKFLTVDELDRICDKYNLIYAPVQRYKMPVPDKNLAEIENSQGLKYEDKAQNLITWEYKPKSHLWEHSFNKIISQLGKTKFTEQEVRDLYMQYRSKTRVTETDFVNFIWNLSNSSCIADGIKSETNLQGLFIAAPHHHFDLDGLEFDNKKGYFEVKKKVIKDPIVFRYVKGGVQVLTKWGLEAEDPTLQIEILN